jgi:hypothetical protein
MALQFAMQCQGETNWCWLAAAASVADFFATGPYVQCGLAQQLVTGLPPGVGCCASPVPSDCNKSGFPSAALTQVSHSQGSYANLAPFVDIQNEIRKGNPVVLRIIYAGSGVSHIIVVIDAFDQGGQQIFEVDDPDGPLRRTVLYNAGTYRNASISWGRTYYTKP